MMIRSFFLCLLISLFGVSCVTNPPKYLYKVLTLEDWSGSKKQRNIVLHSFDKPFVHLAEEGQVDRIVKKYFEGKQAVVILNLNSQRLPGHLVFESNPGGASKYWHLYDGSLPFEAVESHELWTPTGESKPPPSQ